jgi:hypothetical protein
VRKYTFQDERFRLMSVDPQERVGGIMSAKTKIMSGLSGLEEVDRDGICSGRVCELIFSHTAT